MYEDLKEVMRRIDGIKGIKEIICREDCNGLCCKNSIYDEMTPNVSPGEKQLIEEYLTNEGKDLPPHNMNQCRFLSDLNRCLVYQVRPLNCRTHYCKNCTVDPGVAREINEVYDQYFESHIEEANNSKDMREIRFQII